MQSHKPIVGPRGWAMLTLVGGAALASPFLRPPQVEVDATVSESPLAHSAAPGRLASMAVSRSEALPSDAANLPQLSRTVTEPPSSLQPTLPAWAKSSSPIDELISQGAAPPWQGDEPRTPRIQPLQPWIDPPRGTPGLTSTANQNWPEPPGWRADAELESVARSQSVGRPSATLTHAAAMRTHSPASLAEPASPSALSQSQTLAAEPAVVEPRPRQFVFQPGWQPTTPRP